MANSTTFQPTVVALNEETLAQWEKVLATTGLTILSLLTLFGNSLVVASFYTHRPLRSLTNYFIVSLSFSDILVALLSMPIWITFVIMDMDFKMHDGKLLKAWTCFDITFGVASILNLTAVSVDRCILISRPLRHQKLITKHKVIGTIVCIWMLSCGISLIKGLNWDWNRPNYEMLIVTVGFIVPVVIITFCYIKIYSAVRLQLLKEKATCPKFEIRLKRDLKAVKTIAIVVLAFVICWCPFFILNVFYGFCNCLPNPHLVTFAKWLHYSNSAINPLIYACYNKDYRRGFKSAINKYVRKNENNGALLLLTRSSFRESFASNGEKTPSRPPIPVRRTTFPLAKEQNGHKPLMRKYSTAVTTSLHQEVMVKSTFLTTSDNRPQAL